MSVKVLTHYDYRVENMFFGNSAERDMCVIDWQLIMRARMGWDFAYLLGTSLPVEKRRKYADALGDRYFSGLADAGVNGYSRSEFELDIGLNTMAMTAIPVIGGANADLSNPRNKMLFSTIAKRSFSAVLDRDCLSVLP